MYNKYHAIFQPFKICMFNFKTGIKIDANLLLLITMTYDAQLLIKLSIILKSY